MCLWICLVNWVLVWHRLVSHWHQPYHVFVSVQRVVPLSAQSAPFFISFLETEVVQHAVNIIRTGKKYLFAMHK